VAGDEQARAGEGYRMAPLRVNPKVFVVVLNWRRAADTIRCVESVLRTSYQPVEIVVVDNASGDGSVARLTEAFPKIAVIENSENLGYAGGNNAGIRYALDRGADYVLLLNNDAVVDRNLVRDLLAAAEGDRRIGIVGPKIYDYDVPTRIWFAGAVIDWETGESPHIGLGEIDRGQYDDVVEVDRLTGCAMLVSRSVLDRVGLFDPDYFLYYEDVDLCVRAARAGYKSVCVRSAKVWHKESSSTGARHGSDLHTYYHTRNRLIFLRKHGRIAGAVHRDNRVFITRYLSRVFLKPTDGAYRSRYGPRFWALADYYLGRSGIREKYHRGVGTSGA
jgi:GT2 family glycosyltransferase